MTSLKKSTSQSPKPVNMLPYTGKKDFLDVIKGLDSEMGRLS